MTGNNYEVNARQTSPRPLVMCRHWETYVFSLLKETAGVLWGRDPGGGMTASVTLTHETPPSSAHTPTERTKTPTELPKPPVLGGLVFCTYVFLRCLKGEQ